MWPLILVSSAVGAACGFGRLRVWVVVPAAFILAAAALIARELFSLTWSIASLTMIAGIVCIQISYLLGAFLSQFFHIGAEMGAELGVEHVASAKPFSSDLIHAMQLAIGDEMRSEFGVPQDMSSQLRVKVAQLESVLA